VAIFRNSLAATLHYWRRAAVLLSTDKPLYQPEQTLHMRALVLDDQRRAWAKHPLRFTVHDPDDTSSSPLTQKLPASALLPPIGPFRPPKN